MSNSLYTLTEEFIQIQQQLEEMELDNETLTDTLDSLKAPLEEKVENIVKYMKSLEALSNAKQEEAKRLTESAKSDIKKIEWLKNYVHDNLTKANIKELQAGVFKIGFRKGSEVVQIDEEKLPQTFIGKDGTTATIIKFETVPKIMGKPDLKKLIKEGHEIPGVSLVRNPDSLVVK